jgi:hypothetical protein
MDADVELLMMEDKDRRTTLADMTPEPLSDDESNTEPVSDPRYGDWAVTTTDDCYGQPVGTTPDSWCVFDAGADDPPIADRMTYADAAMVCKALRLAARTMPPIF